MPSLIFLSGYHFTGAAGLAGAAGTGGSPAFGGTVGTGGSGIGGDGVGGGGTGGSGTGGGGTGGQGTGGEGTGGAGTGGGCADTVCGSDCVDLATNEDHCGACDHVCSSNHVAARNCTSGVCNPACAAGYLDCSADEHTDNDGCETAIALGTSCGTGCGSVYACDTTHATQGNPAACSSGTCVLDCDSGYLDCNAAQNSAGDGCETEAAVLLWDETKCGSSCGNITQCNTVGGEFCIRGTCQTGAVVVGPVQPYTTIQAAINAVADAGTATIVVKPGTYVEDLSIVQNRHITLVSDSGADTVTIVGVARSFTSPNIDIQADNVVIDGFTIQSPSLACDESSGGIVLTGRNILITNNVFLVGTADGSIAISSWKDTNAPAGLRDIGNLRIRGNTFTDNGDCGGFALNAYEAIYINTQSDAAVTMAYIENNTFDGLLFRALTTERPWVTFSGNTVSSTLSTVTEDVYPAGVNVQAEYVGITGNALNGLESAVRIGNLVNATEYGLIGVNQNCITGNDVAVRFDGTGSGLLVDATQNWWGSGSSPSACNGPPNSVPNCVFSEVDTAAPLTSPPAICP